jgi:hypothetical protein
MKRSEMQQLEVNNNGQGPGDGSNDDRVEVSGRCTE